MAFRVCTSLLRQEAKTALRSLAHGTTLSSGFDGLADGPCAILKAEIWTRDELARVERQGEPVTKPVTVRLPDDVANRLNRLVDRTGRSETFYMVEAIREHLDDMEDAYLAEQRLIDIRTGNFQALPLEEMLERYGSESRLDPAAVGDLGNLDR